MDDKFKKFSELTHFTPKQKEALEATKNYKFVLYGGSMGSGKSYFLRWALVYWLIKLAGKYKQKGIRVGLFCEDYNALNDRHISRIRFEFPRALGTYNEQRHEFTLLPDYGAGVIAFRNLDDPSKYLSTEFAVIAVDEITRNPFSMFSMLRTRLRWPKVEEVKFIAATNPVGEPWVKRYWIDHNFQPEEKEGEQFFYVRALPLDNPYLTESYFKQLESLSESERKAFLEGDWTAFEDVMDEEGWIKFITDAELQNAIVEECSHFGNGVIGVDPAAGGDRTACVYKSDMYQEPFFSQKLKDVLAVIPVVREGMEKFGNVKQVVVDRTGVGEGLYQRMKELKFPVKGIHLGSSADNKERYDDKRAELYFKEKEWILRGGKLLRHIGWNDFHSIKFKVQSDKVLRIQSKEDLRRQGLKSPDVIDAAILTQAASNNLGFDDIYKQYGFKDKIQEIWRK